MSSRPNHSLAERLPPGPNGWITFLYYFGLTSLILSVVIAQILHLDLGTPTPYQYGFSWLYGVKCIRNYFNRGTEHEF
jgi:hypothetical protein